MTRTAIYSLQENTLTEQPAMEKPERRVNQNRAGTREYYQCLKAWNEYRSHVSQLRSIPCHESARSLWKDGQKVEEGKDYEIKFVQCPDHWLLVESFDCPDCKHAAFPLPVKSEQGEKNHTGIFPVQRLTNGAGHSNLTLITEEAIPDVYIGSLLLVPFVNGYKDPEKVRVVTDADGMPVATKIRTCIVVEYMFS